MQRNQIMNRWWTYTVSEICGLLVLICLDASAADGPPEVGDGRAAVGTSKSGSAESYVRSLDIGRAVHEICYWAGGTTYRRTYFSSHPAQVMVLRLAADKPGAYTGRVWLTDAHQTQIAAQVKRITASGTVAG